MRALVLAQFALVSVMAALCAHAQQSALPPRPRPALSTQPRDSFIYNLSSKRSALSCSRARAHLGATWPRLISSSPSV
jgi:hypothetical protein